MSSSFNIVTSKLNIPMGMIYYVHDHGLRKPFACYILVKFLFTGKFHESCLDTVKDAMKIKDDRTFKKYVTILLKHHFLFYNPKSGYYFVRSFDRFRQVNKIKDRTSVILPISLFDAIQSFIDTAIIGQQIQNQKYFWEKGKKRFKRPAYKQRDYANTVVEVDPTQKPPYYGLSNKRIAKELNCSLSQACKRKLRAEKAGLLNTKKHFRLIQSLQEKDTLIRSYYYQIHPGFRNKLRFRSNTDPKTGQKTIQLLQQLHDEIKPLITFSKRCKAKRTKDLYS